MSARKYQAAELPPAAQSPDREHEGQDAGVTGGLKEVEGGRVLEVAPVGMVWLARVAEEVGDEVEHQVGDGETCVRERAREAGWRRGRSARPVPASGGFARRRGPPRARGE